MGNPVMTPLEYFERCVKKHTINLARETERGAPEDVLKSIKNKIRYYEVAVLALREVGGKIPDA